MISRDLDVICLSDVCNSGSVQHWCMYRSIWRQPRGCQCRTIRLHKALGEMFRTPTFLAPTLTTPTAVQISINHGKIGPGVCDLRRRLWYCSCTVVLLAAQTPPVGEAARGVCHIPIIDWTASVLTSEFVACSLCASLRDVSRIRAGLLATAAV